MYYEETLRDAGLKPAESKVYFAVIKLGSSTIGPIIRESGLHSSVAYNALQRLMGEGLISYVIKGKRKWFYSTDPKMLLEKLREKEDALSNVIGKLEALRETAKNKQEIFIFEGPRSARAVFNDILRTLKRGDEQLVAGVGVSDSEIGDFIRMWDKKRVKAGIRKKVIVTERGSWFDYYSKQPLTKVKLLPGLLGSSMTINVYGDKVAIVLWGKYPIYIVIERAEIARNFRRYFELLWRIKI